MKKRIISNAWLILILIAFSCNSTKEQGRSNNKGMPVTDYEMVEEFIDDGLKVDKKTKGERYDD